MASPALTPETCRAARGMLAWSRAELAARSGVSARSIAALELGETDLLPETLDYLVAAFQRAGIVFLPDRGDGPGLRLGR